MQDAQILGVESLLGSSGPLFSLPRLLSEGRKSNQKPGGLWSWPAGLRETRAWEGVQSPVTELVGPRPRPLPSPGARRNWAGPWGEEVSPRLLGPPPRAIRLGSEGVLETEQVGQGADPVSLGAWGPQVWGDTWSLHSSHRDVRFLPCAVSLSWSGSVCAGQAANATKPFLVQRRTQRGRSLHPGKKALWADGTGQG